MSTGQTWQTVSTSSDNTLKLAEQIGLKLTGGEVIELVSDLGGGKTTFVKGLVKGMGSSDHVHSPSFTLGNQYDAPELSLFHFDFYRLSEPGIMRDEVSEALNDSRNVTVVEWADIISDILPDRRLTITFRAVSDTARELTFTSPQTLAYLIPGNT